MMHWDAEEGFAEFEDENLMQFSGGESTEYPSLDDQESVKEARALPVIKSPCHDPVACGGSDEYAFYQRSKEVEHDEHTLLSNSLPETKDDPSARSRLFPQLLDDDMEESDENAMIQHGDAEPEHDEHSLFQDYDESTFFQSNEFPETMDDHDLSAHSRIFGELLDDCMEEGCGDEYSMIQHGDSEPEHDEYSLFQDYDESTFFQSNEFPETMDDHDLSAHSRIFGELLDDCMEEGCGDEYSMMQHGDAEPEHDEHSLFQDYDESTFFQSNEFPETMDDHDLSAHSRIFGELLDDCMEEGCGDEYSMIQHGDSEPEHDEHSLFQDYDESTFFQSNEFPETMDDHDLSAHSRIFGELLDDCMEEGCGDEYSMIQHGQSESEYDEHSLFQDFDAETVDDAVAEESAVEDYILMQYEGSEYPNLNDQQAVLEARSETLHKGDPNRFFGKEEL
jgi:hypothetical protein